MAKKQYCKHNDSILCTNMRRCVCCGWNPNVEDKRIDRIRKASEREVVRKAPYEFCVPYEVCN